MKKIRLLMILLLCSASSALLAAETYVIDTKGMHASINFQIPHLGYSLLTGRFNRFSGSFVYDRDNPSASSVSVVIETASVDSNHAERDKHLRGDEFLHADKFPEATFVSSSFKVDGSAFAVMEGVLTLRGVSKPLMIRLKKIGEGEDPWGGYRMGFAGETSFLLADFGILKELGPHSKSVMLQMNIEGVREE
ncbi:MAG: YceI family protein [Pseudomonadota bacterium]